MQRLDSSGVGYVSLCFLKQNVYYINMNKFQNIETVKVTPLRYILSCNVIMLHV